MCTTNTANQTNTQNLGDLLRAKLDKQDQTKVTYKHKVTLDTWDSNFGATMRFLNDLSWDKLDMSICQYSGETYITVTVEAKVERLWDAFIKLAFNEREDGYGVLTYAASETFGPRSLAIMALKETLDQ